MEDYLKKAIDDYKTRLSVADKASKEVFNEIRKYCSENKIICDSEIHEGSFRICGKSIDVSVDKIVTKFSADQSYETVKDLFERQIELQLSK